MQHAVVTFVLVAALAQPQPPPRKYVPIPLPENAEFLLKSMQIDESSIPPEIRKQVESQLGKMFNDPKLGNQIDELSKVAAKYIKDHPKNVTAETIDYKSLRELGEKMLKRPAKDVLVPATLPDVPAPPVRGQTLDQRIGRWLADWLQNEDTGGRFVEMMRDSPAFQDALGDLLRSVHEADGGWQPNLPDVPEQFQPPKLPGLGEFPRIGMPDMADMQGFWPKMPKWEMPKFSMPQMPDFGSTPFPDIAGDWPQMVVAVVLVIGLLIAMRFFLARPAATGDRPLLPIPVDIATRAELRQAFEALALNRFGDEARPWNHRHVAQRLGHGSAVDELTRLYEWARYAPGDETLSAGDRETVRRSLATLPGAPA